MSDNIFSQNKDLTDKEILGDDHVSEYVKYDMLAEYKNIHSQANEHITKCMTCAQKATRHHLGIGNPLDENGIKQGVHYINTIAEMSLTYLEKANELISLTNKDKSEIAMAVRELKELQQAVIKKSDENLEIIRAETQAFFKQITDDMKLYAKVAMIAVLPLSAGILAIVKVLGF